MKKITLNFCYKQSKVASLLLLVIILVSIDTKAQYRNYGLAFSENLKGGAAIFGNTLMNLVNADGTANTIAMNGNSVNGNSFYDNGSFGTSNMQYVDIDGNTGDGAGTRNSSSADLILPAGANTIKLARLYWGGRVLSSDFDITKAVNQRIKIRKGTSGAYLEYPAAQLDKTVQNAGLSTEFSFYQAFVDITELVQQQGAGTYTVGNGTFSTGTGGDFGNYGAWSIVVVYENSTLNFNSVRLYDGFQEIYNGGAATTTNITLTGLNVPSGALSSADAQIGVITWEGDARWNGDFFKINNNLFSNALNQPDNPWNGTISNNGVHVTSKNPNYTDQMGIDIDQFYVGTGYGILPNATSVTLQFGTNQDQFCCGVVTFVIKMKDPIIKITKNVTDANYNKTAEPGEVLTYKLKGKNIGAGNANAVVLTDSLPSTMTFLANSLKVNYGPGVSSGIITDAAGDDIAEYNASAKTVTFRMGNNATAINGGFLEPKDSFEVEFKVIVYTPDDGLASPIINIARLIAFSDARVAFVDDGTAVINLHNPFVLNYKEIYIPNAFTPNDDGLNDIWNIPALVAFPLAEVKVYNRYGQLIFYNKGYTKQWDGRFKGLKQPIGAYPYTINLKNGYKLLSGIVMLIR
jgi:gliding motility-associated-like protein/uncharacterized repeat protein (TIGR01451 family)